MTKPRKQTVDWFPHKTNHGQTMFILEDNFGNDGYAFWFKLLEALGNSEGHQIDFNNPRCQRYLTAKTRVSPDICCQILDLLSELEAIDPDLWSEKIIWSDHFVEGLAPLYRNRNAGIPVKPDKPRQLSRSSRINRVRKPTSTKSTVQESIEQRKEGAPPVFFYCQFFEVDSVYREKLKTEYPVLDDQLLRKEFSKMEDWLTDNPKPKRSNGTLKNPKNFIRNWLEKVIIDPRDRTQCTQPGLSAWLRDQEINDAQD